jgi:hypothetical protein
MPFNRTQGLHLHDRGHLWINSATLDHSLD